jgi:hypothetical protein
MIHKNPQSPFQETLSEELYVVKPLYIDTDFLLLHLFKAARLDQPLFHPEEPRDLPGFTYCLCSDVTWVLVITPKPAKILSRSETIQLGRRWASSTKARFTGQTTPSGQTS